MKPRRQKLVLATHNPDKQEELSAVLSDLDVVVVGLEDYPEIGEIPEDGNTLLENSLIKARTVHRKTGLPSIGDDTGLEVNALDGAPGIYSARFAGENASYLDNVQKLLSKLDGVSKKGRKAKFRTVISLVYDSKTELWTEGFIEGNITTKKRGAKGFGYDPIFEVPYLEKTFSELSLSEKNKISHRSIALKKMKVELLKIFKERSNK
tara:strand:+ start:42403 stop:43026 length:624 start_codon:yes stop_codon:yes gene_type:complete